MYNIKIGFRGGGVIGELGTGGDMQLFFDCIQYHVVPKYPELNWSILTDRFYRRYLQLNELDAAEVEMKLVEDVFKQLDKDAFEWELIQSGEVKSDLDLTKSNLLDIFSEYFKLFYECIEFGKYQGNKNSEYNKYEPVMVTIASLPYSISYKQIPLSILDELSTDEKPIWWTGRLPK